MVTTSTVPSMSLHVKARKPLETTGRAGETSSARSTDPQNFTTNTQTGSPEPDVNRGHFGDEVDTDLTDQTTIAQ